MTLRPQPELIFSVCSELVDSCWEFAESSLEEDDKVPTPEVTFLIIFPRLETIRHGLIGIASMHIFSDLDQSAVPVPDPV